MWKGFILWLFPTQRYFLGVLEFVQVFETLTMKLGSLDEKNGHSTHLPVNMLFVEIVSENRNVQ